MLSIIKKFFQKSNGDNGEEPANSVSSQTSDVEPKSGEAFDPILPSIWTGVDLDGTLAHWDHSSSIRTVGEPVPEMLKLVKRMVNHGIRVKIFTARAQDPDQLPIIKEWLKKHGLGGLEITNVKDYGMQRLYDDRAIQVEKNTGRLIVDKS